MTVWMAALLGTLALTRMRARGAAARVQHLRSPRPEATHVEPMRGRRGCQEVDAVVRDERRGELGAEVFGGGDLEIYGFGHRG